MVSSSFSQSAESRVGMRTVVAPGQFIETSEGVELYVEVLGAGAPIVFVHGLFGSTEHWQFQTPVFASVGRTIAYDFRGSGRSSKPVSDIYTIRDHANDLAQLLGRLSVSEPVTVVAHSMGCPIAIEFASLHAHAVRKLCLVGGFADGSDVRAGYEAIKDKINRNSSLVPLFENVSFGPSMRWNPEGERLRRWASLEAAKLPTYAIHANARGFSEYHGSDKLSQLAMPALVVVGDEDWTVPLDPVARGLNDRLPACRLEVVGCGHFPMIEAPTQFNRVLAKFLSEEEVVERNGE